MVTFSKDLLHKDDFVIYLKNERTGSSTTRKCKFVGQIVGFTDTKVEIVQLSKPDQFVNVDELYNYGEVSIYPDDIVHVLHSRHDLDNSLILPHTIGNITYYSKEELIEWVENQQEINNKYQIKLELSQPEIEKLMTDMFGTLNIGILDCSDIPEEEIDRIINR
jgi:hypothetical protein